MRVKTEEKRQEIVAVAQQVFREKGYAEASMAEISARLGGSKGTLYSYFESKEELFVSTMLEIAHRSAGTLLRELEEAGDMRAGLEAFMFNFIRALCSPEIVDLRRMVIGEAGRSGLGKLVYEQGPRLYVRKFAELFEVQMRAGRFREVDPLQAAVHMESLCTGNPTMLVLEGVIERVSDAQIAAAARSGAEVFLRAYAVDSATVTSTGGRAKARRKRGHA